MADKKRKTFTVCVSVNSNSLLTLLISRQLAHKCIKKKRHWTFSSSAKSLTFVNTIFCLVSLLCYSYITQNSFLQKVFYRQIPIQTLQIWRPECSFFSFAFKALCLKWLSLKLGNSQKRRKTLRLIVICETKSQGRKN